MKATYIYYLAGKSPQYQRGVVLFIALVALLVMSLAAVALIRSADTNTLIAGNLAAKQSATASAEAGIETAMKWLEAANSASLDANIPASGYYATFGTNPETLSWTALDSLAADDDSGNIDASGKDLSGNTVRYVIQRMCRTATAPSDATCLLAAPVVNPGSKGSKDMPNTLEDPLNLEPSPIYRVTARVVGVKNTVAFLQAFVY